MNEIWITADQHFNHNKILVYTNRTQFMNKHELKEYTEIMKEKDKEKIRVLIDRMKISDTSTKIMNEFMIKQWNDTVNDGDVVIHLGDFYLGSKPERIKFRERLNGTIILILGSHDGSKWRIAKDGFIVSDKALIVDDFVFTHKPMEVVPDGKWNIHGHIHKKETSGRRINLSVEQTDYKPMNIKDLEKFKVEEIDISLCESCNCMTHTINNRCGKCEHIKTVKGVD